MQWLSFTQVEKVLLKLQNGWIRTVQRCGRSWRSSRNTLDRPGRGRKRSVRSPQLLKDTRQKLRRNSRRSCKILATVAAVSKSTVHQILRDDLGVKPFKMLHRQELTDNYVPNWAHSATSPTFWRAACYPVLRSTSKEFPDPCNRTLRLLTLPRSSSPGFRTKIPHS